MKFSSWKILYIYIGVSYKYKKFENEVFNPNERGHAVAKSIYETHAHNSDR